MKINKKYWLTFILQLGLEIFAFFCIPNAILADLVASGLAIIWIFCWWARYKKNVTKTKH